MKTGRWCLLFRQMDLVRPTGQMCRDLHLRAFTWMAKHNILPLHLCCSNSQSDCRCLCCIDLRAVLRFMPLLTTIKAIWWILWCRKCGICALTLWETLSCICWVVNISIHYRDGILRQVLFSLNLAIDLNALSRILNKEISVYHFVEWQWTSHL